jgi:hypothetical protein
VYVFFEVIIIIFENLFSLFLWLFLVHFSSLIFIFLSSSVLCFFINVFCFCDYFMFTPMFLFLGFLVALSLCLILLNLFEWD